MGAEDYVTLFSIVLEQSAHQASKTILLNHQDKNVKNGPGFYEYSTTAFVFHGNNI